MKKRIISILLVAICVLALACNVSAAVILEEEYGYAYDAQRYPAYPQNGDTVNFSSLRKPYISSGTQTDIEGEWSLSEVGAYSTIKETEKDNSNLSNVVWFASNNYDIETDRVIVHELKNKGEHIAYGVLVAVDPQQKIALYIGDCLGGGAGFVLATTPQDGTVTAVATIDAADIADNNEIVPEYYNISAEKAENGKVEVSATKAEAEDIVSVTATPDEGYELLSLAVTKTGDADVAVPLENGSFIMPEFDVTVSATFKKIIKTYTVTYIADGKIVDTVTVEEGGNATAPEIPVKAGYTAKWDKDGKNITADTTITAVYTLKNPSTADNISVFITAAFICAVTCLAMYGKKRNEN